MPTHKQLSLMGEPAPWKLDDKTKEIGRRGIAAARRELHKHTPPKS